MDVEVAAVASVGSVADIARGVIRPSMANRTTPTVPVTIYGAWWSLRSQGMRWALDRADVPYDYAELGLDGARLGVPDVPTVYVDGEWLIAPTVRELREAVERHGFTARSPRKHMWKHMWKHT